MCEELLVVDYDSGDDDYGHAPVVDSSQSWREYEAARACEVGDDSSFRVVGVLQGHAGREPRMVPFPLAFSTYRKAHSFGDTPAYRDVVGRAYSTWVATNLGPTIMVLPPGTMPAYGGGWVGEPIERCSKKGKTPAS
jgi:hypothetical protein